MTALTCSVLAVRETESVNLLSPRGEMSPKPLNRNRRQRRERASRQKLTDLTPLE